MNERSASPLPASVTATTEVRAELLGPLLDELAAESCAHSWCTDLAELGALPTEERVEGLLAGARARRPFTLFTYLHTASGEALAIGTVADKVHATFPWDGFPVIARCFVRPAWRGRGLYPHLVRHRLEACRQRWGEELRAVHLGAATRAVASTVRRLEGAPRFLHVGEERLVVAGQTWEVEDFLAPTARYREELLACDPTLRRFLEEGAAGVPYRELRAALEGRPELAVRQLLTLFEAIGVRA